MCTNRKESKKLTINIDFFDGQIYFLNNLSEHWGSLYQNQNIYESRHTNLFFLSEIPVWNVNLPTLSDRIYRATITCTLSVPPPIIFNYTHTRNTVKTIASKHGSTVVVEILYTLPKDGQAFARYESLNICDACGNIFLVKVGFSRVIFVYGAIFCTI